MISLLSILGLGFLLGVRHATDADHLVAVTTIISQQRRLAGAALTGFVWGLGHSITMLLVGGAILALGIALPKPLTLGFELSVAVTLIVLGLLNLRTLFAPLPEEDDDDESLPAHLDSWFGRFGSYRLLRPLIVGLVHGLAGSAVVALLILPAIRDPAWALSYLFISCLGTVAGMMIITMAIAVPFNLAAASSHVVRRYLGPTMGVGSIGFGCLLAYQIALLAGFFSR